MLYLIFLLAAVSSDSDIYMLETGATLHKLDLKHILFYCLIFGLIEMMMTFFGLNIGYLIMNQEMKILHEIVTIIAMLCISALLFVKTYRRKTFVEHRSEGFELKNSIKQALYTGIDTLLIGIGLSSFGYSFEFICMLSFLLSISSSISAVCIGYYMGAKFQKIFGYANALVYFILANVELIMMFI